MGDGCGHLSVRQEIWGDKFQGKDNKALSSLGEAKFTLEVQSKENSSMCSSGKKQKFMCGTYLQLYFLSNSFFFFLWILLHVTWKYYRKWVSVKAVLQWSKLCHSSNNPLTASPGLGINFRVLRLRPRGIEQFQLCQLMPLQFPPHHTSPYLILSPEPCKTKCNPSSHGRQLS